MISLLLFLTGVFAGILGGLLGLGGGIFLVPALTILFHFPFEIAVGTSLVAVIAVSAGVAAVAMKGRGADVSLALRLEVATACGAIVGGLMAGRINSHFLSILFALVVFFTAFYLVYRARQAAAQGQERMFHQDYRPRLWPLALCASFGAGVISALLGVGGGFIKVPIMYAIMGVPMGIAAATSNFMVGITAAASVFVYYGRGYVHPLIVVPTALGVLVGAMTGVYLLTRLRVAWVRTALIGLLLLTGIQMLLRGLGL